MHRYLVKGALGGLLFGLDTAVIAGTSQQLSDIFHLIRVMLGTTVFIGLVGTVIGALCSGVFDQNSESRSISRRKTSPLRSSRWAHI